WLPLPPRRGGSERRADGRTVVKRAVRLTLALILCSSGLQAQDADSSASPVNSRPQSAGDPAPASSSASPASALPGAETAAAQAASPDEATIERAYRLRDASPWLGIPEVSPESGPISIPAGERRSGPLAVEGTLEVLGTVTGDAVAYGGDLIVRPGGVVQGRAIALVGQVRVEPGGLVEGESVSLRGAASSVVAPVSAGERTRHALVLVLAWLAVVIPI